MNKKTLAFEIGTEELPAFDLHAATQQMTGMVESVFGSLVSYDDAQVYSTPRRIIVIVSGVPESTEAYTEEFRGPEARIAFDADGNPTKAATGFARGQGVDVDEFELREENGKRYVYAVREVEARKVADMLPDALMKLITGISWPKTQRWGDHDELFSRPVRWLLAMLDDEVKRFCDDNSMGVDDREDAALEVYKALAWAEYVERDNAQEPAGPEWRNTYAHQYFENGNSGNCYEFAAALMYCLRYMGYEDAVAEAILIELQSGSWGDHGIVFVTDADGSPRMCDTARGVDGWMIDVDAYNYTVEDVESD